MPEPTHRDELTLLLARAFDRAWNRYYQPRRSNAISEEVASDRLARQLVALVKEGVKEEDSLAERGLQHLIALTPPPWAHFRIESAGAKFAKMWRVRGR
jgi:hypothetical protein